MRSAITWAVLFVVVGCGGRIWSVDGGTGTASGQGAAASGDDSGDDSAAGQDFGVCPPTPPTVGASCAPPGNGCAYVEQNGAMTQGCQAFLCDATGHWQPASGGC